MKEILEWLLIISPIGVVIGCICSLYIDKEDVKLHHIIIYAIFSVIIIPLGIIALIWNKSEGLTVIKKRQKKNDKQG